MSAVCASQVRSGGTIGGLLACGALLISLAGGETGAAIYGPGVSWQRSETFGGGRQNDSTVGNPNPDQRGVGVFYYYAVETSMDDYDTARARREDATPWYQLARNMMRWRPGDNAWRLDGAIATRDSLRHAIRTQDNSFRHVPLYVWRNPAGDGVHVQVTGTYTLKWESQWEIDLVLAYHDVSSDAWEPLNPTGRYARPDNEDRLTLNADPFTLDMDADDELVLSVRSTGLGDYRWQYATVEDDVTISLVPSRTLPPMPAATEPDQTQPREDPVHTAVQAARTQALATPPTPASRIDPGTRTAIIIAAAVAINGSLLVLLAIYFRRKRPAPSTSPPGRGEDSLG
jgi:hypothetical protein